MLRERARRRRRSSAGRKDGVQFDRRHETRRSRFVKVKACGAAPGPTMKQCSARSAGAGMVPDAIAIECSTLSLGWTRELAGHCEVRRQGFVDAPLAGSRPQADARQLIFMVGGETKMFAKAKPLLLAMGAAAHHAGPAGSGMALKLAVNALFGIQVAAAGELIEMLRRQGLDLPHAVEIIGATPVCSPAARVAAGMMLADAFAPMFPIELAAKDFGYALDAAGSVDRAPMMAAAKEVYSRAMARGLGADHLTSLVQLYREGNGA